MNIVGKIFKYPVLLFIMTMFLMLSCSDNKDESSQIKKAPDGGIAVPSQITTQLVNMPPGEMFGYVSVDGGQQLPLTISEDGSTATIKIDNLSPGDHELTIVFEYLIANQLQAIELANTTLPVSLNAGNNKPTFPSVNYNFPDNDSDNISNIDELARGSDPDQPNQAPVISSPASILHAENLSEVSTVSAADPDGDALVFSIIGGDDQSFFTLDAMSGVLSFVNPPDFETPLDSNSDNVYIVDVQVTDGYLDVQQSIAVTIDDVNENPSLPVANAGIDLYVVAGNLVTLDGSASTGTGTLIYTWSIVSVPDDSTVSSLIGANTVTPSFTPDVFGDYQIQLIVNDGANNSNPDSVIITAESQNYNYGFVSPIGVSGAMGGLAGADAQCEVWAATAGIPGNYRAVLSTLTVNASSRFTGARGWVRVDGRPLADLPSELFSISTGGPLAAIRIAADGSDVGQVSAWSASGNNGIFKSTVSGTDCSGWTTADTQSTWYGFSDTTAEWLDRGTLDQCSNQFHVYCLQVDNYKPLDIADFAESGRRIFVSSGKLDVTLGFTGADSLCAADVAGNPDLSGTFKAYLAGVGTSAEQRFILTKQTIVRLDGLRVSTNIATLASAPLLHPVSLQANGIYWNWRVFTGAALPDSVGTEASTCTGWSVATGTGIFGFSHSTTVSGSQRSWFNNGTDNCATRNNTFPVYCLEE